MSLYIYHVKFYMCSCIKATQKSAKTAVGRTAVMETGANIVSVSIDKTTNVLYRLEAENTYQAIHGNAFPYFTNLAVCSSFIVLTVAKPGFVIQYATVQASCDMVV